MDKRGEILINEEVSRQVIAVVERGNIRTAKMVIDLMKRVLNMAAKKGKSLKEFIEEKVKNGSLEKNSISRRLALVEDRDALHLVFKSCFWFAVNTNNRDWSYVFNLFMNAGCAIEELSPLL